MIRTGMMMLATLLVATPALAWDDDRRERREDRRDVSRAAQRVQDERRDLFRAQQRGDYRDVRQESRELRRAEREFARERADLASNRHGNQRYAAGGPGNGRGNGWGPGGRPANDPRWQQDGWRNQGWHAEQFYRSGNNYRPVYLGRNDQVFRGYDNRYYCRRSDGTTGLIIGGLAGGTLGNVIAPGGSKLLGSIIGGSLGAVIGNSVDRNRVACQ
jgi:hypothetical protein